MARWRTTRSAPKAQTAVLSIDPGSTAFRACLVTHGTKESHHVENTEPRQQSLYIQGDFSNACCPFERDPLRYLGESALNEPRNVSAKYLMYLLANADDDILAKYPLSEELKAQRGNPEFLAKCHRILVEMLKNLKKHIDKACHLKRLVYTEIALSMPLQWDAPFEREYLQIIRDVFDWDDDPDKTFFILESDGMANFILREDADKLRNWELALFFEFGGHSMGGSLYRIERFGDSFSFLTDRAFGAGGGSEMWTYHITTLIAKKLRSQGIDDPGETVKYSLTKQFSHAKWNILEHPLHHHLYYQPPGEPLPIIITLTAEEIGQCFDKAMEEPWQVAAEQLSDLQRLSLEMKCPVGIVVAGGSVRSQHAREKFLAMCPFNKDQVVFTSEMMYNNLSGITCRGAGLAIANRRSVREAAQYAGFGIQVRSGALRNEEWDNKNYIILSEGGKNKHPLRLNVSKNNDVNVQLVCDPSYARRIPARDAEGRQRTAEEKEQDCWVSVYQCFNLDEVLGYRKPGFNVIDMSIQFEGELGVLVVHEKVKSFKSKSSSRWTETTRKFPLYFDGAHNCIHIDKDLIRPADIVEDVSSELGLQLEEDIEHSRGHVLPTPISPSPFPPELPGHGDTILCKTEPAPPQDARMSYRAGGLLQNPSPVDDISPSFSDFGYGNINAVFSGESVRHTRAGVAAAPPAQRPISNKRGSVRDVAFDPYEHRGKRRAM